MKEMKRWLVAAAMGMSSILICVLLVSSSSFTSKAKAARGGPTYTIYIPLILAPPKTDLSISINDGILGYTPGATTTYIVIARNNGPTAVSGATVTVIKPGQITSWTVTCVPDSLAACTHGPVTSAGDIVDTVNLPVGKKVTYTILATLSGSAGGSMVTTATIKSPASVVDPNFVNDSASDIDLPPSAVTITDIPDPSTPGQPVVVGVTVSGAGIPVPSGLVAITGADTYCEFFLNPAGQGNCSVIFNTTGHKVLTAAYSGDFNYAPSTGTEGHTVQKGSTTVMITAHTPDPSVPGQAVEVSFTVIGGGATPTGRVDISGADINCGIMLSGGSGSCNVVFQTIGTKSLIATYSGDGNYLANVSAPATHTVLNASTTKIDSITNEPSFPGDSVEVCVSVSGPGATPVGTVTLTGADGGPYSHSISGTYCFPSVFFYSAGHKIITATFSGQPGVYAGSSGSLGHDVNKGTPDVSISNVNPLNAAPNEAVAVEVTVSGPGLAAAPTGTVGISIVGVPGQLQTCTITLAGSPGIGTCSIYFKSSGLFTINAVYSGDGNYITGSDTYIYTVGP